MFQGALSGATKYVIDHVGRLDAAGKSGYVIVPIHP